MNLYKLILKSKKEYYVIADGGQVAFELAKKKYEKETGNNDVKNGEDYQIFLLATYILSQMPRSNLVITDIEHIKPYTIKLENPEKDWTYAYMVVELKKCPICKKWMLSYSNEKPFPKWEKLTVSEQLKKAGWVAGSDVEVDGNNICIECAKAGKADFYCALCKKRKPTSKLHLTIGQYPSEHLCMDCYEATPAKTWENAIEELEQRHRYDFE